MMNGSGLIGFLQILKELEAEATRTTSLILGAYRGPPRYEGHAKDIATQMARILALAQ